MDRKLITTLTGEPCQPARLTFAVDARPRVVQVLAQLRCMREDRRRGRWVWLYADEAAAIAFSRRREELPAHLHPVVLGSIRFGEGGGEGAMTVEVRSFERAIAAARFFGPILRARATLVGARVVNRWFAEGEAPGGMDGMDRELDRDAARMTPGGEDVPEVEELVFAGNEVEADDYAQLAVALRLRGLRAWERWKGDAGVTLREIERRVREEGAYWRVGGG